ncbi:cytochrome C [Rhodovulum sp. BSW8]|uniref:C-type cytochrome n=1 Tax=Rhodovulum visakhapatnamense TaxID=364297 RepID=A0ABS1RKE1_9RHOB|nr:c-type cytochrome [Rhodovulum visakhapatnamense]MBL3579980.1 c-type cytochrome [Rhodovulum visakhapatnamense]RBO52505.1 cytochrome C [Rhodovulum sp. BSW8]
MTGDAAKGEKAFIQCATCHSVVSPSGEMLAGRGLKVGPNLYGMPGRHAGIVEGFRYSKSMTAAGEAGLVWDEEQVSVYAQDPTGFLRGYLDDPKARGLMTYNAKDPQEVKDIYAYIAKLSEE